MDMTQGLQNLSKTLYGGIPKDRLLIMSSDTKISKTVIKGVSVKTFTDTEMLDWLIDNNASVFKAAHKFYVYLIPEDITSEYGKSTPREAITAEMNNE